MNESLTDYWHAHYVDNLCTLCGNSGVIDTRETAISAAGVHCGRRNWCICPNGQVMRAAAIGEPLFSPNKPTEKK